MKYFKLIIRIVFVVASILKLLTIWGIVHITLLERISDDPWAVYLAPFILRRSHLPWHQVTVRMINRFCQAVGGKNASCCLASLYWGHQSTAICVVSMREEYSHLSLLILRP